jgi:hypothetical protein
LRHILWLDQLQIDARHDPLVDRVLPLMVLLMMICMFRIHNCTSRFIDAGRDGLWRE